MDQERWSEIKQVLFEAEAVEPAERRDWLRDRCAGDRLLFDEVDSLLDEEDAAETFIEEPVIRLGSPSQTTNDETTEDVAIGRRIGVYQLRRKLGQGGMGAVYLAERQEGFEQQVALKLLKRGMDTDEIVRRFENERQILARLEHPHIARLLDGGSTEDGLPYFVLEHVEGQPIDSYCDGQRLTIGERLRLFLKVCSAVALAHRNLVVHRDLKPSNILVTTNGEPKLLDFGIAKLLADESQSSRLLTLAEHRPMTPDYASPEQILGEPVTTSSDVYSLGVLLYELLTGARPYHLNNSTPEGLGRSITHQSPNRPSTAVRRLRAARDPNERGSKTDPVIIGQHRGVDPKQLHRRLRGDLDTIVLKALEKDPERRYPTVDRLAEDLRRHLDGRTILARPQTFAYRSSRFLRRFWLPVAAAVLGVVLLGWVAFSEARRARELDTRSKVQDLLRQAVFSNDPYNPTSVRLDVLAVDLRQDLADRPLLRADLLTLVASTYSRLKSLEDARQLYSEILDTRRAELGARHPKTNSTQASLGFVLQRLNLLSEAVPLLSAAIDPLQAGGEDYANQLINAQTYLGQALVDQGELNQGESLLRQVVEVRRNRVDSEDTRLALAKNLENLGEVHLTQGQHEKALAEFEEALEIHQQLVPDHALTARSLDRVARALIEHGGWRRAEKLSLRAYDLHREALGRYHIDLGADLTTLATIYSRQGRLQEAITTLNQARPFFVDARTEKRASFLNNLALTTKRLAKQSGDDELLKEARNGYEEALELFEGLEGNPSEISGILLNLAVVSYDLEDPAATEGYFKRILSYQLEVFRPGSLQVAQAHRNLASFYLREKHYEKALQHSQPPFGDFSTEADRGAAQSIHGELLLRTGRVDEAERFLLDGYQLQAEHANPAASKYLHSARKRLIDYYQATGRPAEAERFRVRKN